jgi:hypothetical protein
MVWLNKVHPNGHRQSVNQWFTYWQFAGCTTTWRYVQQITCASSGAWSQLYPISNQDKGSQAGSWSGKYRGESVWRSNWIVQQGSQVLRTMESTAYISVCTQLSADLVCYLGNEYLDRLTSEDWTGQLQNQVIPISRHLIKAPLWPPIWTWRW